MSICTAHYDMAEKIISELQEKIADGTATDEDRKNLKDWKKRLDRGMDTLAFCRGIEARVRR